MTGAREGSVRPDPKSSKVILTVNFILQVKRKPLKVITRFELKQTHTRLLRLQCAGRIRGRGQLAIHGPAEKLPICPDGAWGGGMYMAPPKLCGMGGWYLNSK